MIPSGAPTKRHPTAITRWRAGVVGLLAVALLTACGGGTSAIDAFKPKRLVVFGDETSTLTATGRKYIVNRLDGDDNLDCQEHPIWVQSLAGIYDFVFAECNPDAVAEPQALMLAVPGARVADLTAQIDARLAGAGVADDTLVTVLAGMHDIIDLYREFPASDRNTLLTEARRRGGLAAAQVNRLVDAGARVIVSTVPDLGYTPYARAEAEANTDTDRSRLIADLTAAFNAGLRTTVTNDGRSIGLALADEMIQAMVRSPASFSLGNVSDGACAIALPDCDESTMVDNASVTSWLWADDLNIGFNAHNRLGILAINRARNNPF